MKELPLCLVRTQHRVLVDIKRYYYGNNLIVETIRPGRQVSLPVPRGRYCIMELPMEDNELVYSEVRYSSDFFAEDSSTVIPTNSGIDKNIIISKL